MSDAPRSSSSTPTPGHAGPAKAGTPNVAKPDAGHPAPVPDHAFDESVAGEEDPGASLDNNANGVPPPKDTTPSAANANANVNANANADANASAGARAATATRARNPAAPDAAR
ncbi:hypothetical protein [Roseateles terrae]|uniref:Uncharacterized protein n=1 Tax=Roseateles terrae TaxID=431060 RepID=A0ABR6GMH2_9BURK|nr:hypothetical protein [Roseateles terrae]MBB3193313.1 hypothetical protein [Roseateles terrae]OWQ89483.1 hypothetical protein CDN98_02840 [Roseateles terrae]